MEFWKEHVTLRAVLIAAFFVLGLVLVILKLEDDRTACRIGHYARGSYLPADCIISL